MNGDGGDTHMNECLRTYYIGSCLGMRKQTKVIAEGRGENKDVKATILNKLNFMLHSYYS